MLQRHLKESDRLRIVKTEAYKIIRKIGEQFDVFGEYPIQTSMKTFSDNTQSTLHLTVSLHGIERSRIIGRTYTAKNVSVSRPLPTFVYNVADIFKSVNPADESLIKDIPDGFLDETQLSAKKHGINSSPVSQSLS